MQTWGDCRGCVNRGAGAGVRGAVAGEGALGGGEQGWDRPRRQAVAQQGGESAQAQMRRPEPTCQTEGSCASGFKAEIPKGWGPGRTGSWRTLTCLFLGTMGLKKERKK